MTKVYILVADDVVDNLTSTDQSVPLSANQGRVLKNRLQAGTADPASGFVGTPSAGDIYVKYTA